MQENKVQHILVRSLSLYVGIIITTITITVPIVAFLYSIKSDTKTLKEGFKTLNLAMTSDKATNQNSLQILSQNQGQLDGRVSRIEGILSIENLRIQNATSTSGI